jgi:RNA polymerase sigma-70 factor (ECF subfamily)
MQRLRWTEPGGSAVSAAGELASEFEQLRPYLLRVAYSHLGGLAEAEDVVQQAWLRLERAKRHEIRNLRGWLTTVVARLAIDALTSARARREHYVGTWLPEPLVGTGGEDEDLADRITLDESVSMALLVVLESLTPAERSAFLLHDVFGYSFEQVADIVGRSPQAARQLAARARRHVEAARPRYPATAAQQRQLLEAFLSAASSGDVEALVALLDPQVEYRSDGGGRVPAAEHVLRGANRVAGVLTAMAAHYRGALEAAVVEVNGTPGLLVEGEGTVSVVALTVDAGRIRAIDVIRNPDKLRHLAR